ncbi:transport and Golgi organization protein 1 homolog [Stigmatopora argus]
MAAKHFYRKGFLLLLFNFISTAALEKRFSDLKRCADEECSMLLCRGKAVEDFTGPDCRFLSFKKSETVYVYYKLSGERADIWAGSAGSNFGYFPMDLLAVNHVYTDKEVEAQAQETDFVCFDTGFDQFDNYDIDSLLGFSNEEGIIENKENSDKTHKPEETNPLEEEMLIDRETRVEDDRMDPDDQSASFLELGVQNKFQDKVPDTQLTPIDTETTAEEVRNEPITASDTFLENVELKKHEIKDVHEDKSLPSDDIALEHITDSTSQGEKISELKTSFGSTFDAVTTDAEDTTKVTSNEQEADEVFDDHSELHGNADDISPTLLLSMSEEEHVDSPEIASEGESKQADKVISKIFEKTFSHVRDEESTEKEINAERDWEQGPELETAPNYVEPQEDNEPKIIEKDPRDSFSGRNENPENLDRFYTGSLDSVSVEQEAPENLDQIPTPDFPHNDPIETVVEELLFDQEDEDGGQVIKPEETTDETPKITDMPIGQDESKVPSTIVSNKAAQNKVTEKDGTTKEVIEEVTTEYLHDSSIVMKENGKLQESFSEMEIEMPEELITPGGSSDLPSEKTQSLHPISKREDKEVENSILMHQGLHVDFENDQQGDSQIAQEQLHLNEEITEMDLEKYEERQELLEDENALSVSQSYDVDTNNAVPTASPHGNSISQPVYSDSVLRLTLLQDYYAEEKMARLQKFLGLQNLFKVESMFSDLDTELKAARLTHSGTVQDLEEALENILEASENTILDEIEKMLDSRHSKYDDEQRMEMIDDETEILDDFQELAFSLRQKYSLAGDSTPLAEEKVEVDNDQVIEDKPDVSVKDNMPDSMEVETESDMPEKEPDMPEKEPDMPENEADMQENEADMPENEADMPKMEIDVNYTEAEHGKEAAESEKEVQIFFDEGHTGTDNSVGADGGHFNNNQENQQRFSPSNELQKFPQASLESSLDKGLSEVEHSLSGSVDSFEPLSELHEEEKALLSEVFTFMGCAVAMIKTKIAEWTILIISQLPEEWKPAETFFGCPWQAVIITVVVGILTFTIFFWKTVLAVKKREYLVDEKQLADQIQALKREKNDALTRMSELQKQTEDLKETQKESKETVSCTMKKMKKLESQVLEAGKKYERMLEEKKTYQKQLDEEKGNSVQIGNRIQKLEKSNEKLELSRKKVQEALAKTTVLLDEAKIREDAHSVQHKCLAKDYAAMKEENKNLKVTLKGFEDKHVTLTEQIKGYQKSQKELEDSVVLKDHNVEVLSELLADLDACEMQKSDGRVLVNGEVAPDKKTAVKNRIKQMMDVARVQTTLAVIEEERDRFMSKLLNEEKNRRDLEEKHQEFEHSIATLKSEKSHVENQFNILQQKNEIMVEMYQQKENALQQRLTKEELERRSKESMLSEVGGKAVEAEEQVKILRQRINEMEEQMKKTEEVYKEQIKEQENKTHSNWVNARNGERALNQEKLESSKLREMLAALTSQLNERRAPLFRPNSGQAAGPRQGDSYGPSPVSGGAPSPPLMIEGPRRPPSAPVGRRVDPYGPRPPSDPHSRYPGIDMSGPRSSSPANMDGSGPASFITSPIRDSPGPISQGPPGPGPHDPHFPPGPHNRMPSSGPYRPPRPPLYHPRPGPRALPPNVPLPPGPPLSANGHPGMPLPGPMGGDFPPRPANGHSFHPRLGPGHIIDPRGPPPPPFRPPPPHHFGPMQHGPRGPMGPRPPFPPDMRFPGPREHSSHPADLPPGVPPQLRHSEAFAQPPADAPHRSVGAVPPKQEDSQDSRMTMVEP